MVKSHFIKRKPEYYRQYTELDIFNNVLLYWDKDIYLLDFKFLHHINI